MLDGNGLKGKFSNKNKLTIYKLSLFGRIMTVYAVSFLTLFPLVLLLMGYEKVFEIIIVLVVMLSFSVWIYFFELKKYVCVDIVNKKIVICDFPNKKECFSVDFVYSNVELKVSDGTTSRGKECFTLDIVVNGFPQRKIDLWSRFERYLTTDVLKRRRKRVERFVKKCNVYLKKEKA